MGQLQKIYWMVLLGFVSGCIRIPDCELAVSETSCGCANSVSDAVESGDFEVGDWIEQKWWERFDDSVLTGLIEQGLKNCPNLLIAQERLKAAAQIALEKKAALYPEINLDVIDSWCHLSQEGLLRAFAPTVPPVVNDFIMGLSFVYEFDFWGKNRDLFKSALGEMAAKCAETMQAELVMTTAIAYTYFELQFLLFQNQILQEQKANLESINRIRIQRQEGAIDSALTPLHARSNTLDLEVELKELGIEIEVRIHKLKALAGAGQDMDLKIIQQNLNPLRLRLPETLGLDLIGRRPDLIAQKKRLEAAAKQIDAAKTDFYPNVNLKAFLGPDSVVWSQLFRSDHWDLVAMPALHLPIFTAGRIRAQLYEKVADFNQAVYSYNELILQAARQVADLLTRIGAFLEEIELRKETLQTAQNKNRIVERRFQNALDTRIDFLSAQDEVLRNKMILAQIEYGTQLAEIDLIRALGGGFHE